MRRTLTPLFTAGLALVLATPALAQTPRPDQQPAGTAMNADNADQDFVQKAAMGGKHEVEGAKIAAAKASNAGVKAYANMLVKDHTAANNELLSLAKKKRITTTMATAADKPMAEPWRSESGAALDRAYIDHAITEHEKDIALFEAESKDGRDADVKAWAEKKLPTLRAHLKAAQDLKAKLQTTSR